MTISSPTYTRLDEAEYTQHRTLGPNSGYRIENESVVLEPLNVQKHSPALYEIYKHTPELFQWMPHGAAHNYKEFLVIQERFGSSKDMFHWVVYLKNPQDSSKPNTIVGSICLLDVVLAYRRFEVGAIWFRPAVHGSFVMLETTLLLLQFSFDRLQAGRVQWKTHHANIASQKAAIKLGFSLDGIHRKHILHHDNTWRNTLYYSITDDDWYGRELTTDGRQGLDMDRFLSQIEDGSLSVEHEHQGLEKRLEELVASRKVSGKQLDATLFSEC